MKENILIFMKKEKKNKFWHFKFKSINPFIVLLLKCRTCIDLDRKIKDESNMQFYDLIEPSEFHKKNLLIMKYFIPFLCDCFNSL